MDLRHAGFLLLLLCSAYCYQFRGGAGYGLFVPDPEQEWERMEAVIGEEMAEALAPESKLLKRSQPQIPEAKKVPEYLAVPVAEDRKEAFKPEKGARALPDWLKERLRKTASSTSAAGKTARSRVVEVLCHVDRMYVRIKREVFKTSSAYKYLKLGKCAVNQGTKAHYYLLYLLTTDCGFNKESKTDYRSVKVPLRYNPTTEVLREMPFNVTVECKYPRLFHSYKVGFYPIVQGGTIPKKLQPKSGFILTLQDASGNDITGSKTYTLGQPMYFEARQPSSTMSGDQRLYINKCFMTASTDPNSSPKHALIDNYGCMVEGKMSAQSKFLPTSSKMAQKFRVTALIFKEKLSSASQQLYMHCDISMGKLAPTPTSKACNYDAATKKWKALFGPDSVCTCCDSTCSSAKAKSSRDMISSHSWKVDMSSRDGFEVEPRMKFSDPHTFRSDDLDMAEHEDFLQNWDHDY
ncbi:zona pellucida sperm-binding protein 3 isoform X1 [Epinephelus fuscoguttatus]|uniref:zona pellucida sperm-binding protein 3 isoform X1 n=1 Tax=Epinephelus fuscoguttatus TaxID=293821 RepID=UPI0020D049E2|nr:zona pellucida sperm-binding protein 3 isoform X1 [Epinephelus fuscoguttatus]